MANVRLGLSPSAFIFITVLCCLIQPIHTFYWGLYPVCAQSQLGVNAPAQCDTNNAQGVGCLCASTSWLTGSARLVWQNCGCDVLTQVALTSASICQNYGYSVALNPNQVILAGDGGTTTCVNPGNFTGPSSQSASATSTATGSVVSESSASNSTNSPHESSLSTGAIAGIVVGAVLLFALAALITFAFFILRRERHRQSQHLAHENGASPSDPLAYVDAKAELGDTQKLPSETDGSTATAVESHGSSPRVGYVGELHANTARGKPHELDAKASSNVSELQA